MLLGVFACPQCRRVQAAELRFGAVSCKACRKRVDLADRKYYYRGEDEALARATIVRVSAQLGGLGLEDYAKVLASLERDSPKTAEDALQGLAKRASDFTQEDLSSEMLRLAVRGDAGRVIAGLLLENRVYEPRPGRYRFV